MNFVTLLLSFLAFSSFIRIVLFGYAYIHEQISPGLASSLMIFLEGIFRDLMTFSYIIPVIILISFLFSKRISQNIVFQKISKFLFYVYLFCLSFLVVSELTFWEEFGNRFNFIAVDYLIYTKEVVGNIVESYPLKYVFGFTIILSLIAYYFFRKTNEFINEKFGKIILTSCVIFGIITISMPSLVVLPVHENQYEEEIAKNGVYSLIYAYLNNSLEYHKFYKTIDQNKAFANLREKITGKKDKKIDLNHQDLSYFVSENGRANKKNIILITVESLSAEFLSHYGNQKKITPYLDDLLKKGLNFTNYYATGTRTVRGLEAISLSIPPTPGTSIVRKFNNENLFSLGSVLKNNGYDNKFIYGGFGYFDNMSYFFSHNNFSVIDRNDLPSEEIEFSNIWGVSDEDLYKATIKQANKSSQEQKPFFLFVMTTSNHRPYTYPENKIDIASGTGREGGVKYTDYAIGQFMEMAKKQAWYKNTIFVITADHCASSAGKTKIPIKKYHIPLIIFAGDNSIKPQEISDLSSQIDLAPTMLSLLKISYKSKFFGSNILKNPKKRAFLSTYQLLSYLADDKLCILSPKKKFELFKVNESEIFPLDKDLSKKEEIFLENCISYYQTADFLYTQGLMKEYNENSE